MTKTKTKTKPAAKTDKTVKYTCFKSKDSINDEFFISICPKKNLEVEISLEEIHKNYLSLLQKKGLSGKTQIFCRFYLSDIANQKNAVISSKIFEFCKAGSFSIIEQRPVNGGRINFFAYHIKNNNIKNSSCLDTEKWSNQSKIIGNNYQFVFASNLYGSNILDSNRQTADIFSSYNNLLESNHQTLLNNTIRTWIFVRDIDNHYGGMVKARREFFEKEELTKETRFIASTGIEGKPGNAGSLVSMDALSISGLDPKQIVRMEARENLNPTHEYGVTFERGTKILYGDRAHIYISGTASIDKYGQVLHLGDAEKQTERILENIKALLAPHDGKLADMMYLIVYLRNIKDVDMIKKVIKKNKLDRKPLIFVEGAVCRPTWLVEIEGEAVIPTSTHWPNFL